MFPLNERFALLGWLGLGTNLLEIDAESSLDDKYAGLQAWAGVGMRYFFNDRLGLDINLSGMAAQEFGDSTGSKIVMLRFQVQAGLVIGF